MTPTPEQLIAVADWLDECMECGKQHEFILNVPDNPRAGGTWANDGHSYFRRAYTLSSSAGTGSLTNGLRRAAQDVVKT